jgi:hypothetical protein
MADVLRLDVGQFEHLNVKVVVDPVSGSGA